MSNQRDRQTAGSRDVIDRTHEGPARSGVPPQAVSILDTIEDSVIVLDREWRFTYLNRAAAGYAKKSPDELLGRSIWETHPKVRGTPLESHFRQAMADQVPHQFTTYGPDIGRWFEMRVYPAPAGLTIHSREITEQRPPEEALRERDERFRAFMDHSPAVAFMKNEHGRFLYFNKAHRDRFQGGGSSWLGKTISEVFPPDVARQIAAHDAKVLASGQTIETFDKIPAPDGSMHDWWVFRFPVRDATGRRFAGGVALDVTERRQAEEALQESHSLLDAVIEGTPDIIFVKDLRGRYVMVNSGAARFMGKPPAEAIGKTDEELFSADTARTFREWDRRILERGERQTYEEEVTDAGGETRAYVTTKGVYRDPHGQPLGTYGIAHDITDRRRAEEALRQSEERLRRFFEAAFEGIGIHEAGLILDANRAAAEMFGYEQAEVLGKRVSDFVVEADRARVSERIASCYEQPYEATGLRKDGSAFPMEVCGKEIPYAGRTARVVVLRDITWRKQAEEKLQDSARRLRALSRRLLEVQEQERRYLARELHDQIGQVLTGLNYSLQTIGRLPEEKLRASLGEAQWLVKELTSQVRDLSLRLRPTMLDDLGLFPALRWLIDRYQTQAGVAIAFEADELPGRLPPEVETAAYRIVQEALTNVARHARVKEASVGIWLDENLLHLQVEDRGAGFDVSAAHSRAASSGLSGMQERAVLLGGRLAVESRPGTGTRVTAELPIRKGEDTGHGFDDPIGR